MDSLVGVHHFYLGLIMAITGFFMLWGPKDWIAGVGIFLLISGFIIAIDDAFQHAMERFYRPGYQSPLKIIYIKYVYKYQWVKDITFFFDKMLGK